MCLCWASSCIRTQYYAHLRSVIRPISSQMNLELLGNSAASDARQHVKVTQTKGAVECAGNFPCFVCVWLDSSRPAVWQRWLCGGRTPHLLHLPFPSIRCSSGLFIYLFFSRAAETWRAGACMCIGLRGRFTWSCYSLISRFKFSLSPRICCHGGASATLALKACMALHASTTRMDRRLKRPVSEQKVKQLLLILRNVIMRRSKSASFVLMYEIKISYNTDRSISTETSDFNERSSGCH